MNSTCEQLSARERVFVRGRTSASEQSAARKRAFAREQTFAYKQAFTHRQAVARYMVGRYFLDGGDMSSKIHLFEYLMYWGEDYFPYFSKSYNEIIESEDCIALAKDWCNKTLQLTKG